MQSIGEDVFSVGVRDWDRRLFDELIPLPDGTTYNSYLVSGGEKTALIDAVDPPFAEELLGNIRETGVGKIDYVIANHAEQDHSGGIVHVLDAYPDAKVVANEKCQGMLMEHLHVPKDRFITVGDRDTLELGGKTLEFISAPWVQWPDTMLTYLGEDKILFPCDLFGSHLATSSLFAQDECKVYESAKRYYAEIMMPFRNQIIKHLKRLEDYDINIIASSHGPIYDNPGFIIDAYRDWVSDDVENEVVLPYVSMHGSVKDMAEYFIKALETRGVKVKPFNLTVTDIGELAMALVDAATIVVGSPTVLGAAHPSAVYATYLANALRPKTRHASIIGSYGWGGRMPEQLKELASNLNVEFIEPVVVKGHPGKEDYARLDALAEEIKRKHDKL